MSDANAKEKAAAEQPDSTPDQTLKPSAQATPPVQAQPDAAKPETAKSVPSPATAKPEAPATADATKVEAAKPAAAKPAAAPQVPVAQPDAAAAAKSDATTAAKPAAAPQPPEVKPAAKPATDIKFALVVDDEPANRDFLMRLLEQAKLDVKGASNAKEGRDLATAAERLDLIVIDHKLPDGDGVDLMVELRAQYPDARMVMATMLDERALMDKAFENGCDVFLVKPHGFMELFRRIKTVQATGDVEQLKRMIIDQYGPRPYRG